MGSRENMIVNEEILKNIRDSNEREWEANQEVFGQDEVAVKAELFLGIDSRCHRG